MVARLWDPCRLQMVRGPRLGLLRRPRRGPLTNLLTHMRGLIAMGLMMKRVMALRQDLRRLIQTLFVCGFLSARLTFLPDAAR